MNALADKVHKQGVSCMCYVCAMYVLHTTRATFNNNPLVAVINYKTAHIITASCAFVLAFRHY